MIRCPFLLYWYMSELPGQIGGDDCKHNCREHIGYSELLAPDEVDTYAEYEDGTNQREVVYCKVSHNGRDEFCKNCYGSFEEEYGNCRKGTSFSHG